MTSRDPPPPPVSRLPPVANNLAGDYLGGDPLRNPTFRSNRDEAPAVDAVSKNAPRNINSSDNRFNPNIPHLQDSRRPPPPLLPHQPSLDGPSGNAESDRDDRKKDDGTGNKKSFERSTTTRVTYDGGGSGRGGGGKEGGIRKKAMGGWKGGVTIHASTDINQDVEVNLSVISVFRLMCCTIYMKPQESSVEIMLCALWEYSLNSRGSRNRCVGSPRPQHTVF